MRVLGLVPARGGSRRIPRKNLARLGGKTLVRRALETAVVSGAFDLVALSTEDEEIAAEATGLEGVVLVRRPEQLATSDARAYDVLAHALHALESSGHARFEAAAIVQCTSPFTAPEDLRGAVAMLRNADAASVVSVAPIDASRHPLKLKRMEGDRLVPYLADDEMTPSHELPPLWIRNGSIYVTRRTAIDAGQLVSDDVLGYRMPPERSFDIDTERDLIVAELLIARGAD